MSVTLDHAEAVAGFFDRNSIRTILVGGLAINVRGGLGTEDVDLLVLSSSLDALRRAIKADSHISDHRTSSGVDSFWFRMPRSDFSVRVDVLDPAIFSGGRSGDELFDYVWENCSDKVGGLRVARLEFVWYTRLLVPGDAYRDKIARDIENGGRLEHLDRALEIAKRFGTIALARKRARETLELATYLAIPLRDDAANSLRTEKPD